MIEILIFSSLVAGEADGLGAAAEEVADGCADGEAELPPEQADSRLVVNAIDISSEPVFFFKRTLSSNIVLDQ